VSTSEELLERKSSGSGLEKLDYDLEDPQKKKNRISATKYEYEQRDW
jgi:hypothetical protein